MNTSNVEFVTREFGISPNTPSPFLLPLIFQCKTAPVSSANELPALNSRNQGHDSETSDEETVSRSDISEDEDFLPDLGACEPNSCLLQEKKRKQVPNNLFPHVETLTNTQQVTDLCKHHRRLMV